MLGASILESLLLPVPSNPIRGLSLGAALAVGLIEEGCKIAVVAFLARRMLHTSQMDRLLLGGAVGTGFAAFENTGYAFTVLLLSHGHVSASIADGLPNTWSVIVPPGISLSLTTLLFGVSGIATLSTLYRGAMIQRMQQPASAGS